MADGSGLLQPDQTIPGLNGSTVGDFWRWAYSDVLSNRNRSIFAEFITAVAIGAVDHPRVEWDAVDLRYRGFKIEVKSSAFRQSWFQKRPSTVRFSVRKAVVWNPETGEYEGVPTRAASVYIFCLYTGRDKAKANVLDLSEWEFYVALTTALNREFGDAKSISLASVRRIADKCGIGELKAAVDRALKGQAPDAITAGGVGHIGALALAP
jgi:hypothetical protein